MILNKVEERRVKRQRTKTNVVGTCRKFVARDDTLVGAGKAGKKFLKTRSNVNDNITNYHHSLAWSLE